MIAPIPFGIGVDFVKSCATWCADHLVGFGFSISWDEVKLFKHSAIASNTMNTVGNQEPFMQWVADNVDHNNQALTGKGTFHGKDISISVFSKVQLSQRSTC